MNEFTIKNQASNFVLWGCESTFLKYTPISKKERERERERKKKQKKWRENFIEEKAFVGWEMKRLHKWPHWSSTSMVLGGVIRRMNQAKWHKSSAIKLWDSRGKCIWFHKEASIQACYFQYWNRNMKKSEWEKKRQQCQQMVEMHWCVIDLSTTYSAWPLDRAHSRERMMKENKKKKRNTKNKRKWQKGRVAIQLIIEHRLFQSFRFSDRIFSYSLLHHPSSSFSFIFYSSSPPPSPLPFSEAAWVTSLSLSFIYCSRQWRMCLSQKEIQDLREWMRSKEEKEEELERETNIWLYFISISASILNSYS